MIVSARLMTGCCRKIIMYYSCDAPAASWANRRRERVAGLFAVNQNIPVQLTIQWKYCKLLVSWFQTALTTSNP